MTQVILVDEKDRPTGVLEKMEAHKKGLLHRAFSVFIFNNQGKMLIQQRAVSKYHSGGLWTNACCSHPNPGEDTPVAAQRRLKEELNLTIELEKIFDFVYKTEMDSGLTEHEFDHVFAGEYDGEINFNKDEVMDLCYKDMRSLRESLQSHPQKYTVWFGLAFPKVDAWWNEHYKSNVA